MYAICKASDGKERVRVTMKAGSLRNNSSEKERKATRDRSWLADQFVR